ncbi:family 43 glycosylhydrolase [Enterococcus sp. DIV0240d]|uniref:family 43 glycosylhydrolase n=1 Tax=Enterococcus sp. DIV0240d TaxID=2774717 RepID=UPI003F1EDAB7
MKNQAVNPFLPNYEYIPDGEPYRFGDRIYLFGSHDKFDGNVFCENDYVCWSTSVANLSDWRYEGIIYHKTQDPHNLKGDRYLYAPDVQLGIDNRYYLYYALDTHGIISVAVCDTPAGKYQYYGTVKYPDGRFVGGDKGDIFQFDPGVLIDNDKIFLYSGIAPVDSVENDRNFGYRRYEGAYCLELESDMLTVKNGPNLILPKINASDNTSFSGHEFFEASSMRKVNGMYYLIYSSINGHELCYATSKKPDRDFIFGGTIISNGDVGYEGREFKDALNYTGNNHGSIIEIDGQWYVFYHRHTNQHSFSRQACAERIYFTEDGHIPQVEMTSCGLNDGVLIGKGKYPAYIACNLIGPKGTRFYPIQSSDSQNHPYFTQTGDDRESNGDQYIANITSGTVIGYKYFDLSKTTKVSIQVRGSGNGKFKILNRVNGEEISSINIKVQSEHQNFSNNINLDSTKSALYFKYEGTGIIEFLSFTLS